MRDASAVLLLLILITLLAILVSIRASLREHQRGNIVLTELKAEWRKLRLGSNSRQSNIEMRPTDPRTAELQSLQRLGRSSRAKRSVVGGEEDSQLSRQLRAGERVRDSGS